MVKKIGIYRDSRNKRRPWVCRWFTITDPEIGKRKRFSKSFELYEGTIKRLIDFFGKDSLLNDITLERAEDFILA